MSEVNTNREAKKQFWSRINTHLKTGGKFFEELELLSDAMDLWMYVSQYDHFICTATGNTLNAKSEKFNAIVKHFGQQAADNARFVRESSMKAQHALPHHILIDDRLKSVNPWVEAGGIGILHKSAEETICRLKDILV